MLSEFEGSSESVELLIYFITQFRDILNYLDISKLLSILKLKLDRALHEKDNFLLYVRNPLKILVLLIELLVSTLKLTRSSSPLRHQARAMVETMKELAVRILKIEGNEEKTRLTLTDTDIGGRDVVTLIC